MVHEKAQLASQHTSAQAVWEREKEGLAAWGVACERDKNKMAADREYERQLYAETEKALRAERDVLEGRVRKLLDGMRSLQQV